MTRDELIETMARAVAPAVWADSITVPTRSCVIAFHASRQESAAAAAAYITAIEAAGLAIVPVEATDEMLSAAWEAMFVEPYDGQSAPMIGAGLDAMIEAGRI